MHHVSCTRWVIHAQYASNVVYSPTHHTHTHITPSTHTPPSPTHTSLPCCQVTIVLRRWVYLRWGRESCSSRSSLSAYVLEMLNALLELPTSGVSVSLYKYPNVCVCVCVCAGDEVHPRYVEPPVIPGHEFIGEVVKLGPGTYIKVHIKNLFTECRSVLRQPLVRI